MTLDPMQTFAVVVIGGTVAIFLAGAAALAWWQAHTRTDPRPHDDAWDADTAILRAAGLLREDA